MFRDRSDLVIAEPLDRGIPDRCDLLIAVISDRGMIAVIADAQCACAPCACACVPRVPCCSSLAQTWHQHSNRTRSFRPLWIALLVEYPDEA